MKRESPDNPQAVNISDAAGMLRLADAMRSAADPIAVQNVAMRMLGEHLGVHRAFYFFAKREACRWVHVVESDGYRLPDAPDIIGRDPRVMLGERLFTELEHGETLTWMDTRDLDVTLEQRQTFLSLHIEACVVAPIIKGDRLVGGICVQNPTPREWTAAEIALIGQVAERTWDAVERARAEAELRESEEKFRTLFHTMGQGYAHAEMVRDAEGHAIDYRFIELNPAFERHMGLRVAKSLGRTAREIVPEPEDWWLDTADRVVRQRMPERVEYEVAAFGRWMKVDFYPAEGDCFIALYEDVTRRKRVEAALRESEERQGFLLKLSDALRQLDDPVAVQTEAARVLGEHLGANRALYTEIEAGDEHNIVERDYAAGVPSFAGRYRPDDYFGAELMREARAGRTFVVIDTATDARLSDVQRAVYVDIGIAAHVATPLVKGGRLAALFMVMQGKPRAWTAAEVSLVEETAERTWSAVERARAEAALRESEQRFQYVARATCDIIWDMDLVNDHVWWSEAMASLGYAPEDIGPDTDWCLSHIHPDDRERVRRSLRDAIVGTALRWADEFRYQRADGSYADISNCGFIVRDAQGKVLRMIGAMQDITARKRAEEALRESEAKVREASRAKDQFLAILGHELRNPLAPITTTLHLMKLRAPEVFVRERATIGAQVQYLTELVDDLLDVSRFARGEVELKITPVEIADVVAAAIETTSPLLEEHRQTLRTDVQPKLFVAGDRRRLVQILVNLLTNAAKYSPRGSTIHLDATAEDRKMVLRVRDEGQGIAPELLPHVFELFTQETQAIDRSRGGLGLGLAIVRNLVELHGGSVEGASEGRGKGSEFSVRLPLLKRRRKRGGEKSSNEPTVQPEPVSRSKTKVLIVDDYVPAAESLALLLGELGCCTRIAYDGAAALRAIDEFEPDVALVDIGLPVMDGYEVARTVRGTPGRERLPLVAVTGYGQPSDHVRVKNAGFDEHLVKPVNAAKIGQLITRLVAAA